MRIDPADAPTVQFLLAHEGDNFGMSHNRRVVHSLVACQKLLASALVADEELAVDELVAGHFVLTQQVIQGTRVWRFVGQEADPDGGVNQDAHVAEWRDDEDR